MSTKRTPGTNRDYASISPSAKGLLLLKGLTAIPYARAAAELISQPEKYEPDFNRKDFTLWARTLHFENRYRSINQLLSPLPFKNILELSSGFSFRSLATVQDRKVHYIDTDLPGVIDMKQSFIASLQDRETKPAGKLELLPLNALDEQQFKEITSHFPEGEIVVVNEGLLMYLDTNEKKKLCKIIRDVMLERGGYWITADIYTKEKRKTLGLQTDDALQRFFKAHHVEENKFESFEAAEAFFKSEGFIIDEEAEPEYANCSSLKYLLKSCTEEQLKNLGKTGKINATWRLKAIAK